MKQKVFLKNFGCQMNVRDAEVICGILKNTGYQISDTEDNADIVIFNTCSVRQHAEDKVWSAVGRSKAKIIGICGCMANNYRQAIFEKAPNVDFAVGTGDIGKIPQILAEVIKHKGSLREKKIYETDADLRKDEIYHTGFHLDRSHAFVVISEGCENLCSYCVVPFVRGPLRSRKPDDIIREISEDIEAGISKITLLGQNVNAYRFDALDFPGLLRRVGKIDGLKEFGFVTSHPKDTTSALFEAMAEVPNLKKYLHLPVQSGSDRILRLMNRGYTVKEYLDRIANYRKIVKGGALTSDIIVGFPGETEEDFRDSFELVNQAQFDAAYIFKYSPRPHTEAAKMDDDVAKEAKDKRHALILELQKKISLKRKCLKK